MAPYSTFDLARKVVGIDNGSGAHVDKFKEFKLTLVATTRSLHRCFVLEVVKAHATTAPKFSRAIHHRGDGLYMISGRTVSFRRRFTPEMPLTACASVSASVKLNPNILSRRHAGAHLQGV